MSISIIIHQTIIPAYQINNPTLQVCKQHNTLFDTSKLNVPQTSHDSGITSGQTVSKNKSANPSWYHNAQTVVWNSMDLTSIDSMQEGNGMEVFLYRNHFNHHTHTSSLFCNMHSFFLKYLFYNAHCTFHANINSIMDPSYSTEDRHPQSHFVLHQSRCLHIFLLMHNYRQFLI
jgi:hypothetical protein